MPRRLGTSAASSSEQLLTHTGGFAASSAFAFWQELDWERAILERRAATARAKARSPTQTRELTSCRPSLSDSTDRPVLDYAREKLFDPIRIDSNPAFEGTPSSYVADVPDAAYMEGYSGAGFAWPTDAQGYHFGDCCLKLRPQDLTRLGVELFLDAGESAGQQVVPAAWVDRSTTTLIADAESMIYGYLWWMTEADGSPAFAATGGGGPLVEVVPERDLMVLLASEFNDRDPARGARSVSPPSLSYMVAELIAPHLPPGPHRGERAALQGSITARDVLLGVR